MRRVGVLTVRSGVKRGYVIRFAADAVQDIAARRGVNTSSFNVFHYDGVA